MSNRTLFIATLFFLLSPWCLLGLGNAPEEPEKDIHVSEEVKIDQQQEQQEQKQKEKQEGQAVSAKKEDKESASKETSEVQAKKQAESGTSEPPQKTTEDGRKSAEKDLQEMTLSGEDSLIGEKQRLYTRKGRVDPFAPFLNKQPEQSAGGGEEGRDLPTPPDTPLTRVSLSQLKLTAILQVPGEKKSIAMVEDQSGKGYVINKGTYVGESGAQVSEIKSDSIVLREKYKDVYGKIAVREIEKKLQK